MDTHALDVEQLVRRQVDCLAGSKVLQAAALHHLSRPGKAVRARMAYAVARGLGHDPSRSMVLAVVSETIHNASLVLDDVQDQERSRRGLDSVWVRYGIPIATNLSTAWLNAGLRLASRTLGRRAAELVHEAVEVAVAGQSLEASWGPDSVPSADDYARVAAEKTGALLALPVAVPLVVAGAEDALVDSVQRALQDFGVAYQVRDDVVDLGTPDDPDGDLSRGRWTLPSIVFHAMASTEQREQLRSALAGSIRQDDLSFLLGSIHSSPAIEHCRDVSARAHASFDRSIDTFGAGLGDVVRDALRPFSLKLQDSERRASA